MGSSPPKPSEVEESGANGQTSGNVVDVSQFEGQPCTDGTFNGFCGADGRCGLNMPVNEFSRDIVSGQCGQQ